ncbi:MULTISPECIES: MarR family winged helix-turn-helix transcriptional regulator [Lysinibacillus]|uniref:MarR family winged helix-turn-helix transcriptional regulator n=1 Tax=Lysinibacillus TaxID=400634 RepID=UPI0004D3AC7B|nr:MULTISPECIES: MarR family winged helix-turn-helix transcriptional regulator [Lysinibacillus]MDC6266062.1 MarR family winged helix-turn-helix transcriptional regulator [Lysinibacillus sphaericus]AJK88559.1 MarR family transcriptional regulator [Lysinibacillus fusiformis]KHK53926.1 MarR family transcriptional regulator [Lysinibacillus sp. A1]MCE4043214.1 MarR family winged helix-turn-helix transcriptional regulator [Lysinibacillus fusiformis]MDN4969936.1 MarR family winged helix-turn-helix tr
MDKSSLFHQFVTFTANVHQVTHELTQNVTVANITPLQYKILEYIKVSQPVTPTEISECQHMSLPNTSRELRKLQDQNLIEKWNDTEDRRKQYIRLSIEGERMMEAAFACIEERFLQLIQHATQEDIKDIQHALSILEQKVFQQKE